MAEVATKTDAIEIAANSNAVSRKDGSNMAAAMEARSTDAITDTTTAEVKDWTLVSPRCKRRTARPADTEPKSAPAASTAPVAMAEPVDPVEAAAIPTADITNDVCGSNINIINNNNNHNNEPAGAPTSMETVEATAISVRKRSNATVDANAAYLLMIMELKQLPLVIIFLRLLLFGRPQTTTRTIPISL